MEKSIQTSLIEILSNEGLKGELLESLKSFIVVFSVIIIAILADWITRKIILVAITKFVTKSKTEWDDILLKNKFFNKLAHIVPAIILYSSLQLAFNEYPTLLEIAERIIKAYFVFIGIQILSTFMKSFEDIYNLSPGSKTRPIRSYIQITVLIVYFLGGILIISTLMGKNPGVLLTGLGAMTAVLMLVFKDSILGFVAGIQLASNNMVQLGDWIEMPSRGADGDVIDITLHTVKVKNWDKTISTIPTYALVTESFKNWRGMSESGGRRIKRSIMIDMNTIRFCTIEMLEKYERISLISNYITTKIEEIEKEREEKNIKKDDPLNGRRLTNVGVFRKYCEEYVSNHPKIHGKDTPFTFLLRQLQPTEKGLPLEIYCFSNDQVWANYEGIQADIFDHLLAIIGEFDLLVFQNPSGNDLKVLGKK
jgi:miniconductance mechanosensitive channel